jgi:hypothetical protein
MLRLNNVGAFYSALSWITRIDTVHENQSKDEERKKALGDTVYQNGKPNALHRDLVEMAQGLKGELDIIGAKLTGMVVERLLGALDDKTLTFKRLGEYADSINSRIRDELSLINMYVLDSKNVGYFESKESLFGPSVDKNFPTARIEIEEAGKCLALRRSTACVMHLMRVLEIGLQCLAEELGVPPQDNWNAVLGDIERIIPEVTAKRNGADEEQWFSEAAAHFRLLKNAWRNHAMHVRETYSEEQAEKIFSHAQTYMQHLATKLSDKQARREDIFG